MTSGVYRLTFKKTGEFYVGSSIKIEKRFRQHIRELRAYALSEDQPRDRCSRLTKTSALLSCNLQDLDAIQSEYKFEILEVVEDRSSLLEREQHWYDAISLSLNKTRPSETSTRNRRT
jgi:predicted GIY-YIG superfamily endonuclease